MSLAGLGQLQLVNRAYRTALFNREREAFKTLADVYFAAWWDLQDEIEIASTLANITDPMAPDFRERLFQEERLIRLQQQMSREMSGVVQLVEGRVVADQEYALRLGRERAIDQIKAAYGIDAPRVLAQLDITRIPTSQLQDLVGFMGDGSPLRAGLQKLGPDAVQRVTSALASGLLLGEGPGVVAMRMRDAFEGNLARAMTTARTEMLRVSRTTQQRYFRENSDIVSHWMWTSALEGACAACIALHGTIYPLDEEFGSHPACRCAPTPIPPRSRIPSMVKTGEEYLREVDETELSRVLGKGGARAYAANEVQLSDFVQVTHDAKWGTQRKRRPLKAILGTGPAREWTIAAD